MRLIANKRLKKYGTRHLVAGDEFDAAEPYARVLVLSRLAKDPQASAVPHPSDKMADRPVRRPRGRPRKVK